MSAIPEARWIGRADVEMAALNRFLFGHGDCIEPGHFVIPENRFLAEIAAELEANGRPVDHLTLLEGIRQRGCGQFAARPPTTADRYPSPRIVQSPIFLVEEHFQRRQTEASDPHSGEDDQRGIET